MVHTMIARFLIAFAALLLPAQVLANTLEGHWAFRIEETTIFVFRLDQVSGGSWIGAWKRPAQISSNGAVFQRMAGRQIVQAVSAGESNGVVELTFAGPPGTTSNDILRFRLTGENQAELTYVGLPVDPFPLIRVLPDTELGPFEAERIYDRDLAVTEAPYEEPWQPQGLVDQALAALRQNDAEPVAEDAPVIEEVPVDIAEAPVAEGASEEEGEEDRPRITADFLDDL